MLMIFISTKGFQNMVTSAFDMHRDSQVIKSLNVEPNVLTKEWTELLHLCLPYFATALGRYSQHEERTAINLLNGRVSISQISLKNMLIIKPHLLNDVPPADCPVRALTFKVLTVDAPLATGNCVDELLSIVVSQWD